jgi:hypothetical protein
MKLATGSAFTTRLKTVVHSRVTESLTLLRRLINHLVAAIGHVIPVQATIFSIQ